MFLIQSFPLMKQWSPIEDCTQQKTCLSKENPMRFGCKQWCICGITGAIRTRFPSIKGRAWDSSVPLGTKGVNCMLDVVQEVSKRENQSSLTTFYYLFGHFEILKYCGVKVAGTVRVTRTGGAIQHLKSDKDLKQEVRGTYDFISS